MSVADTFDRVIDRQIHAVYNPLGRVVGYYDNLQSLAAGNWIAYTGEVQPPRPQLRIKNLFGVLVNAGDYLISKGLVPVWITPNQKAVVAAKVVKASSKITPPVGTQDPGFNFTLPSFDVPGLDLFGDGVPNTKLGTYVIWGGLGAVAYLILTRK